MKISVVIPAYNGQTYLAAAITSALSQTYPAHEVLVIDDGSTDGTADIANSFGRQIRFIRQPNQGVAGARNRGIAESTGDWIALLDHDDEFLPDKLRVQAAAAEGRALHVVYCGHRVLCRNGNLLKKRAFPPEKLWPVLRYCCPLLPSTTLIRKSALLEAGGFNLPVCPSEDWDLWIRFVRRWSVEVFDAVDETLITYRLTPGSQSSNAWNMVRAATAVMESVALSDTRGLTRMLWRQRIVSRLLYDASITLREEGSPDYLAVALRSFWKWPLAGRVLPPRRYKVIAHMLWSKLIRDALLSRNALR